MIRTGKRGTPLQKQFTAVLQKGPGKGGWTSFRSSFMAMGDGTHKLPVKAEMRRAIHKEAGESVTIRLEGRLVGDHWPQRETAPSWSPSQDHRGTARFRGTVVPWGAWASTSRTAHSM